MKTECTQYRGVSSAHSFTDLWCHYLQNLLGSQPILQRQSGWKWKLTSTVCSLCLLHLHPAPQKPQRSFQRRPGTLREQMLGARPWGSGSVAPQEQSHTLIEVATEAPSKKPGGYFTVPTQPDPNDQFIIPPELEEEVKEIMKQHQQDQQKPDKSERPADYYDTPLWRSRCILSSSTQPDLVGFNPVLERRAGWYKK